MYYNSSHVFLFFLLLLLQLISFTTGQDSTTTTTDSSSTTTSTFDSDSTSTATTTTSTTTTAATATATSADGSSDESTSPVNQDVYNSKDLFTQPPKLTDVTNKVQIRFYCEVDPTFCKKVQSSFLSAATRFSEVVNLKNKIVIQATYYSFCLNKCSNSTFGWGTPSSQFTLISLNEADSNFIYPQPLARQLAQFTDSSNWANYDVSVDINHDIYMNGVNYDTLRDSGGWNGQGVPPNGGFWFNDSSIVTTNGSTNGKSTNTVIATPTPTTAINGTTSSTPTTTSILDTQVDLEYVILHQLIHGLGMVSSWAPYFSDTNSPFQQLLNGLIVPSDNLKIMTPSPYWFIKQHTGPAYITGFQPNMIFDKFLNLLIPSLNQTVNLVDYSFDMQNFCAQDQQAFIVNFMNSFLNNATQSSRAKAMYVSMSIPKTLSFIFNTNYYLNNNLSSTSAYYTNNWLNTTYKTIQLETGPSIFASSQQQYYRPGISTSHIDDQYVGTPDFLMTSTFIKGKTLQSLVEDAYTNIPTIKYNTTITTFVNVTTLAHNTTTIGSGHNATTTNTTWYNVTKLEQRQVQVENAYKSAIGPGILRILETIGYSTVLTNTNYSTSVIKTNKPETTCDDNNNNLNARSNSDDSTPNQPLSSTVSSGTSVTSNLVWCIIVSINVLLFLSL